MESEKERKKKRKKERKEGRKEGRKKGRKKGREREGESIKRKKSIGRRERETKLRKNFCKRKIYFIFIEDIFLP